MQKDDEDDALEVDSRSISISQESNHDENDSSFGQKGKRLLH